MSRELRPRKSRPSYMAMAGYEFENEVEGAEAGPSIQVLEADSGSDFAPGEEKGLAQINPEDEDQIILDPETGDNEVFEATVIQAGQNNATAKRKAKAKPSPDNARTVPGPAPGLSRTPKRQMYVLPTPSVHHRHRAVPLFSRVGPVERLTAPPVLFCPSDVTSTNNFTQNRLVTDRVNKAWGYNVGSGPLWEMLEDRGWYKEALGVQDDAEKERNRRPRVHCNIGVKVGWEILNIEDAALYLPTDAVTTEEGNFKPPPPVPCSFGPFGKQTRIEMEMFQTLKMSDHIPGSKAHVFNAGAPVWGLDWCPIHPDDRPVRSFKQYLAVAPFPSRSHSPEIGVRVPRPSFSCIQIWSFGPTRQAQPTQPAGSSSGGDPDLGQVKCEMVLCLDGGPAHELKWCPLPSHDEISDPQQLEKPRKLGLIAGTFEDGSLSIYAVPDPLDVTPPEDEKSHPVFVRLPEPLVRIELEETACWTLDWANSEVIAVGTTNGIIAVYDIAQALKEMQEPSRLSTSKILPTHYLTVHQSAIRALAWIRAPPSRPSGAPRTDADPTVIASGGYDGLECLTDIREGHGSVMNRTRDVINAMAFSPFGGGPITIDHENTVKAYSASPSMLGRGHTLLEPSGPVWTVNASDYHPQLAVGSADGSCATTNTLRSTRRGGSVPFFVHKIYQLDYSRNLGEYRMLERFLPQETQDRPTASRAAKSNKGKSKEPVKVNPVGTGVWPREVGIHRVVWNSGNGLAAAGLLASATAAGLCRIDVLAGRWLKGKIPYGSITQIRREVNVGDDMDVDDDSPAE